MSNTRDPQNLNQEDPDIARSTAENEIEDEYSEEEIELDTFSITAYGADYPVDALVRRIADGDIVVPTFAWTPNEGSEVVGFQRNYVWPKSKADKFIESLLLGLPVPGIFLVRESSGRFLVLDGHQRLYTLRAFTEGLLEGKEFRLEKVQPRFVGKSFKDLETEDRRRLQDSIIHSTIVRQDEPSEHQTSIYIIFERLNTGGVNLQPQEIRVALYHGAFVQVLKDLNENRSWRNLVGAKSNRLKDMEMILRFFAFHYRSEKYKAPMKDFLNKYMAGNRALTGQGRDALSAIFENTVSVIDSALGSKAFRPVRAVNAAVLDSVMTAVARRLGRGPIHDADALRNAYAALMANESYTRATKTGTSQEANVKARIELAEAAFANLS